MIETVRNVLLFLVKIFSSTISISCLPNRLLLIFLWFSLTLLFFTNRINITNFTQWAFHLPILSILCYIIFLISQCSPNRNFLSVILIIQSMRIWLLLWHLMLIFYLGWSVHRYLCSWSVGKGWVNCNLVVHGTLRMVSKILLVFLTRLYFSLLSPSFCRWHVITLFHRFFCWFEFHCVRHIFFNIFDHRFLTSNRFEIRRLLDGSSQMSLRPLNLTLIQISVIIIQFSNLRWTYWIFTYMNRTHINFRYNYPPCSIFCKDIGFIFMISLRRF